MTMMTPERAFQQLRKTPVILAAALRGLSQERAEAATDGPDGWNVVQVVCHLRDFEEIFLWRGQHMLAHDKPAFPPVDQNALAATQQRENLAAAFDTYRARRQAFITFLETLSAEQWERRAIHALYGEVTLLEVALNAAQHDVNHIEQIVRAVGLADAAVSV
jgi:uncharacterized damage-inducible protein DinB